VVSLIIVDAIVAILNYNLYIILIERSMKPLNLDNSPCSPISSNCVIWQGPDLACIKLCKGDTVSDVVAKLATELCTILDQLNVDNYDLTCFNSSACPPVDFQALIQFLISHICALENTNVVTVTTLNPTNTTETIYPTKTPQSSTCPDCVVSIAPCFVIGTQTTMQLTDYVTMIAERVCGLIDTINTQQIQINNIDGRVTALENVVPTPFTLPSIIVNCTLSATVLGGIAYPIDTVLNALINDSGNGYCSLISSTGLPADLFSAVSSQCISSSSPTLTNAPVPFGTEYLGTWVNTPTTVANSITNLWISLCDIYTYLSTDLTTTVVVGGEDITVTPVTVGTTTTYTVDFDGLNSFVAEMYINTLYQPLTGSLPAVDPLTVAGILDGVIAYRYNTITSNNVQVAATATPGTYVANGSLPACSFGTLDNDTTGEFTTSVEGMYLLEGNVLLKSDDTSSVYWQTGSLQGSFGVGLITNAGFSYANQFGTPILGVNRQVDVSTSTVVYLRAGAVIKLSLLNLTSRSYNGNTYTFSDTIRFSITKLR
jgi:hypothetical protein